MASLHCDITWPELTCPNLVIRLCVSSKVSAHVRTLVKIAPTWRDKVSAEYKQLITKFKVSEIPGSEVIWEAIKQDVGSSAYSRVLVKPYLAKEKVFLAGYMKDVTQTEPVLRKLIEDTRQKIYRQTHIVTVSEPLNPAFYEIMTRNNLLKNIVKMSPDLKMDYDPRAKNLQFIGLGEEVRSAKSEIQSIKQQLKSKPLSFDQYIMEFLKFADSKEMSTDFFIQRNINAVFEVERDAIKLSGLSARDLSEAEKIITQELVCNKVTVEDKSLLKSVEWQRLHRHLQDAFNSEKCRFLMEECPRGAEDQVVISGISSAVNNIYESVHEFIGENTPMKKEIIVQSMAVARFLGDEKKPLWGDIGKMNVKYVINQRTITLNGSKPRVLEAAACIEKVLSSLCTDTLRIDKPGAKTFCKDNEDYYVGKVKNDFHCVIYLQKDGDSSFTAGEVNLGDSHFQITISGGVTIAVYKGDLSRHRVDVAVNAANEDLKHVGGLALDLSNAAGPKLQADCDQIIRNIGKLLPGDSVVTDPGNLPYKQVIHAVGPRWDSSSQPKCERLLRKVITRSLELAAQNGHSSIAIPAVSSGIFGFPVKRSVENIIESIKEYAEDNGGKSSLKRIHLVDNSDEIIKSFVTVLRDGGSDQKAEADPESSVEWEEAKRSPRKAEQSSKPSSLITREGLTIRISHGNIQDSTTDVIVNSVGKDLDLTSGAASRALFNKAGKDLQDNLNKVSGGSQATDGSLFVTAGGGLSCSLVIHTVVPEWDAASNSSEKVLRRIVSACLNTADSNNKQSISFPAIGTGNLKFPKDKTASLMFEEFLSFSSKGGVQHLQEICVVLHPSDNGCIMAFSQELARRTKSNTPQTKPKTKSTSAKGPGLFGTVTSPALGVHEMKIGSIIYQVKTGDITKEDTDIIVNSSNNNFTLKAGVSKAILEAAGQSVEDECKQLGAQPHKGHIITQAGNLLCKKILHVHLSNSTADRIKECMTEALQQCEKHKATSVAFPALGTGSAQVSSSDVAAAMLDALGSFSTSAHYIQKVKVVIFQQNMLNDFHTSMKSREGSSPPKPTSLLGKVSSWFNFRTSSGEEEPEVKVFELKEDIEPAIFHLCGQSQKSVKEASSWLLKLILKEQSENTIKNDWIKDFGEQEWGKLQELQKRSHVTISLDIHESKITIFGLTRDVLNMTNKIQALIDNLREQKIREREAELCSNMVEWRYNDGLESRPVDIMTNLELENAKTENKGSFMISIKGVKYTVNMEEKSASDSKGKSVKLERVPKSEQSLPAYWDTMDNNPVKVISLNAASQEYLDVKGQFAQTCHMIIIEIKRIQNPSLWKNYEIKKQSIDNKNGNTTNEKQLFHGTDPNTISHVNHHGFNRSYAGKNAACYGNGTYFAVNAMYSAHDTYSRPDVNGYKYMYLTRVITGVYCVGTQGMVAPPAKNPSNPTDLYDSVTDNMAKPSMFVIFNDIQAYPEYLITFSK
uniref:Poly [ADP-ribose] polymerase n=1 Tax=Leptobrachium leishanense TaxID=445787 RepID=A0A8C5Q2L0_9ANUR